MTHKANGSGSDGPARPILQLRELRSFSAGLVVLTEMCSERMSLGQAAFFMFAGMADLAGKPTTFTDIRDRVGPAMGRTLHTTYKVFLGPDEIEEGRRMLALGWLMREIDPKDNRRKYLRLTKAGRAVMEQVSLAIERTSK